jgi:hypothetical protein
MIFVILIIFIIVNKNINIKFFFLKRMKIERIQLKRIQIMFIHYDSCYLINLDVEQKIDPFTPRKNTLLNQNFEGSNDFPRIKNFTFL